MLLDSSLTSTGTFDVQEGSCTLQTVSSCRSLEHLHQRATNNMIRVKRKENKDIVIIRYVARSRACMCVLHAYICKLVNELQMTPGQSANPTS